MSSAGNISASAASSFLGDQKSAGAGKGPASGEGSEFGLHLIRSIHAQGNGTGKATPETPFTGDLQSSLVQEIRQRLQNEPGEQPPRISFSWNEEFGGFFLTIEQRGDAEQAAETGEGEGGSSALLSPPAWARGEFQQYLAKTDEPRLALVEDGEVIASNVEGDFGLPTVGSPGEVPPVEGVAPQTAGIDGVLTGEDLPIEDLPIDAGPEVGSENGGAGIASPAEGEFSEAKPAASSNSESAFAEDPPPAGAGSPEEGDRIAASASATAQTQPSSGAEKLPPEIDAGTAGVTNDAVTSDAEETTLSAGPADLDSGPPDAVAVGTGNESGQGGSVQVVSGENQAQNRAAASASATVRDDTSTDRPASAQPVSSLVDPAVVDEALEGQSRYDRPSSDTENAEGKSSAPGEAAVAKAVTDRGLRSGVSAAALTFAAALKGEGGTDEPEFSLSGLQQHGSAPLEFAVGDTGAGAARAAAQIAQSPAQSAHLATQVAVEVARHASQGTNRFQIRLDPPELGRVDVRLKIQSDGSVQAHLTVERSETLDLFMRDQRGLERALDAAGLKIENGSVQFSLKDQGGSPGFAGHDPSGNGGAGDDARGGRQAGADGEHEPSDSVDIKRAYVGVSTGSLDIRV
ncbi:flagellar hook-length control protein FliK [Rhizobiales bacterium]|uniref:flagellar hook-length control protein FliK n=1 Tax=Hongsoonwoonella zoysiae TaxID=2821844 RepID=UPI0015610A40|nr:flagellar hook-length control protein FliK [Hongsoonwoonella zoysiae]NRG17586.1 flagellar hook-length control protein FliK [Hongsoonwoonella zoysiae]